MSSRDVDQAEHGQPESESPDTAMDEEQPEPESAGADDEGESHGDRLEIKKKREEFYEWYMKKLTYQDWFKVDTMSLKKPKPSTVRKYLNSLRGNGKPLSPAMAKYKAYMIVQTALRWPPMMTEIATGIHATKMKQKMIPVNAARAKKERNQRATETEEEKKARNLIRKPFLSRR